MDHFQQLKKVYLQTGVGTRNLTDREDILLTDN